MTRNGAWKEHILDLVSLCTLEGRESHVVAQLLLPSKHQAVGQPAAPYLISMMTSTTAVFGYLRQHCRSGGTDRYQ